MAEKFFKLYKYLFYKFYSWHVFLHDGNYGPESSSLFTLSLLIFVNVLTVLIMLQVVTGYELYRVIGHSKLTILLSAAIFLIINYFIFMYKNKYLKINKKYSNESRSARIRGNLFVFLYIVGSFVAMVGAIFLLKYLRPGAEL